uniref:Uncharacterized protein n=1 Tax=Rhizophora mucronata TaxID=61149 RepID=A0A2P2NMQ0_RHIMU
MNTRRVNFHVQDKRQDKKRSAYITASSETSKCSGKEKIFEESLHSFYLLLVGIHGSPYHKKRRFKEF